MSHSDRYIHYYLDQQQGNGMNVFRGSPRQNGHGQVGYGLGGLFRSVARVVMPIVKSGAKTLGNIALSTGANLLGDVLSGKNVKESAKSRLNEAANFVQRKAVSKLQTLGQTGNGVRLTVKKKSKKGKTPTPRVTSRQTKKRKSISCRGHIWIVMDFVHPTSVECARSELHLFTVPSTQTSLEKGRWIDHRPVSSVSDNGATTFLSPGTEDYIDSSKTILVVRAKVTKANGANLDANMKVEPINNFMHSLFKQVDVLFKEKQVTQATETYMLTVLILRHF